MIKKSRWKAINAKWKSTTIGCSLCKSDISELLSTQGMTESKNITYHQHRTTSQVEIY